MRLRQLEMKDAPFMLQWMHDSGVVTFNTAAIQQAMSKQLGYENGIYTWEIRFYSNRE